MTVEYNVSDVEKWLLAKEEMSPKKLQKMLYYSYSWVLAFTNDDINELNNRLFDDTFEGWLHGPVLPDVYQHYKEYGFDQIEGYHGEVPEFTPDVEDILNQVFEVYGKYGAEELESITRQEEPCNTRMGLSPTEVGRKPVKDKDIFQCYVAMVR